MPEQRMRLCAAAFADKRGGQTRSVLRTRLWRARARARQAEVPQSCSRADRREDLKRMLRRAGAGGCRCMFLSSDTEARRSAGEHAPSADRSLRAVSARSLHGTSHLGTPMLQ
jgi:hypothetical protein